MVHRGYCVHKPGGIDASIGVAGPKTSNVIISETVLAQNEISTAHFSPKRAQNVDMVCFLKLRGGGAKLMHLFIFIICYT